jgi:tetratricopeptide (TPR) repeat protein
MVRSGPGYAEDLEGLAAQRISACTLELHDPLTAVTQIEEFLKLPPVGTALTRRRLASLLVSAARESGAPERAVSPLEQIALPAAEIESLRRRLRSSRPDPLAGPRASALQSFAQGHAAPAMREIESLLAANPLDRRLHYDYGRMLQLQGRLNEAQSHLELASDGDTQSRHAEIAGWALLRLGWAREVAGQRALALDFYRRASQLKRFTFQAAALDLLDHPALFQPEG